MFDPNDIFISLVGTSRLTHFCLNLELYSNFSFRDNLHINVVYNGEYNLKELININNLFCDNFITLSENRGYQTGALDLINASLKGLIESDRNIGVIHNFDFLFFYDNPFKNLIVKLIDSKKYFLGWEAEPFIRPVERKRWESDCFIITKEFAKKLLFDDIMTAETDARANYNKHTKSKTFDGLKYNQKMILIAINFNLGRTRASEYDKLSNAVKNNDWASIVEESKVKERINGKLEFTNGMKNRHDKFIKEFVTPYFSSA